MNEPQHLQPQELSFFSGDGWMPRVGVLPPLLGLGLLLFV